MTDHPETGTANKVHRENATDNGGASQSHRADGGGTGTNGTSGTSAFDRAKAAMLPYLDEFAEGAMDEASLLIKADEVADLYGVRKDYFAKWVRQEIGKLKRKPRKPPPEQDPGGIPDDPAAAWAKCKDLAEAPDLIKRLLDAAWRLGIAGDKHGVLCEFLLMVSRLLKRPAAVLRKGAAASGKNFVTDTLIALLNPYDFIKLTAASAKALVYSARDFRHRFLTIAEAAALVPGKNGNDEFAMMLRELLSSGRIIYHTVERTEDGKLVGVEKEQEGPVAFSLTTARENIEEELDTRILTTLTDESKGQSKAIIAAVCDDAAGMAPPPLTEGELAQWRALQDWLRLGCRDVVIPFAPALSSLVAVDQLRIRRDISGVLALVQASALWHRAQRQLDGQGRIIAEIWDYAVAISALGDGLDEIRHGDTAKLEEVRRVVAEQLDKAQRQWWRRATVAEFREALALHCDHHRLTAATQRLHAAGQSQQGRGRLATARGCVAVATDDGKDPSLATTAAPGGLDQLCQRLLLAAGRQAADGLMVIGRLGMPGKPSSVEISSQALANLLGIGRKAARVRLDNAIEAGVVLDESDASRARTAPRKLAPGQVVSTPAGAQRYGAFPAANVVEQEWRTATP
jgi:hypothetical protein